MTHVLLTGAGFSRNWGGWLATEAFEYLLGAPEINDQLRSLLWQDNIAGNGFEDTLARLQEANDKTPTTVTAALLDALMAALVGMFNKMGLSFMSQHFEFQAQPDINYTVAKFLTRFDEIYTLNQDTLLEYHYLNGNIAIHSNNRFGAGWQIPGMRAATPPGPVFGSVHDRIAKLSPLPKADFGVARSSQPYFKLHGSANWNSPTGRILIMGGNKASSIDRYEVLAWYHQLFRDRLKSPNTKLMVIGYSFSDKHINEAIIQGLAAGMKLFIIDPNGNDVLVKKKVGILPVKEDVLMPLLRNIVGGSRRPLFETFNKDHVEHAKVMKFFDP
jgi:hypothetical protein